MISFDGDVFFQACRTMGGSFGREASRDPKFKEEYESNRAQWDEIAQGLLLTLFCHLIEVSHGDRNRLKSKLKTPGSAALVDPLFIARNSFIHCNWDISKLDRPNQIHTIRNFIGSGYKDPTGRFEMTLSGDRLHIKGLEAICNVLLSDL